MAWNEFALKMNRKGLKTQKKGTARDVVFIAVSLFAFALVAFLANFLLSTGVDKMLEINEINESIPTRNALLGADRVASTKFDQLVLGLFIGFILAMIISSWIVGGNPVFMFIYFIIVVVSVILSMVLANTWESVTQASTFGTTINNFPIANHILSYLPLYIAIIGVLGLIVMFAKPFMSGGGD
jgi:hypothetical protein